MNVFFIDRDPVIAAYGHVNRHVHKMAMEAVQILTAAHILADAVFPPGGRRPQHMHSVHIPWAAKSTANYQWLHAYGAALAAEYTRRYGKPHCYAELYPLLTTPPQNTPEGPLTEHPQVMGKETSFFAIPGDPLSAYRHYYIVGKAHLHAYRDTIPPLWLTTSPLLPSTSILSS